jgi:hypothetical protein
MPAGLPLTACRALLLGRSGRALRCKPWRGPRRQGSRQRSSSSCTCQLLTRSKATLCLPAETSSQASHVGSSGPDETGRFAPRPLDVHAYVALDQPLAETPVRIAAQRSGCARTKSSEHAHVEDVVSIVCSRRVCTCPFRALSTHSCAMAMCHPGGKHPWVISRRSPNSVTKSKSKQQKGSPA